MTTENIDPSTVQRLVAEVAVALPATLGEGPVWDDADGALLFVDLTAGRIHRYEPATEATSVTEVGQEVGAVLPAVDGGLLAAARDGIAWVRGERLEFVAGVEADNPANRMNDAKCDPQGRLWAGTMAFDAAEGAGALYRVDADMRVTRMLDGLTISNGLGWSADGRRMYFIDSMTRRVDLFSFDAETGDIGDRRPFVEFDASDGLPDGMTVDAEDCVWVALFGAACVKRFSPEGDLLAVVELPVAQPTSCTFGGPGLEDLYITTARHGLGDEALAAQEQAGSVFRCRPGTPGTPAVPFGGRS